MHSFRTIALLCAGLGCSGLASAIPVLPLSYDMINGGSDPVNGHYWDKSYGTANATIDYATLSGGHGDLTDGVIATQNWDQVENLSGNGPYVGWIGTDPQISFYFNPGTVINSVTFYVDDSNGNGGVRTPSSFVINGVTYPVSDPAGSAPASFSFTGLNLAVGSSPLQVQINRADSLAWTFVSEVSFDGTVPEPGSLALLALGGAFLPFRHRRRLAHA